MTVRSRRGMGEQATFSAQGAGMRAAVAVVMMATPQLGALALILTLSACSGGPSSDAEDTSALERGTARPAAASLAFVPGMYEKPKLETDEEPEFDDVWVPGGDRLLHHQQHPG